MKATRGQIQSPPRKTFDREEVGVEFNWRKDRFGQVSHEAFTGDGKETVQNPKEQDESCKGGNYNKQGTNLEGAHMVTEIKGIVETNTEDMGSAVSMAPNSNVRVVVEVDDSMHVLHVDPSCGPQSPKQKATWTRLR